MVNEKLLSKTPAVHRWLRSKKEFPNLWCPGCGNGIVLGATIQALDSLGLDKNKMVMVSGIGCAGRLPVYVDCNTLHTTHGRALTFATGIKLANPDLNVMVFMGDGDALAIGGNHFIHSCRRNIDITAVVINNNIYGMTGGQTSPTTPHGAKATTAMMGNMEQPFDTCDLARSAGATFVARSTVYHVKHAEQMIKKAVEHKGFSVVEVMSNCHTAYGRLNRLGSAIDMLGDMRDRSVMMTADLDCDKALADGKDLMLGVVQDRDDRSEFCQMYGELTEQCMAEAK